jgi:hypothetical protein
MVWLSSAPSDVLPTIDLAMTRIAVWTVGHSNHEFDAFARLVAQERVEFLIDVRSFPYSRFAPQFNCEELQTAIGQHGIGYLFLGEELGGRPASEDHYDEEGHALYGPARAGVPRGDRAGGRGSKRTSSRPRLQRG